MKDGVPPPSFRAELRPYQALGLVLAAVPARDRLRRHPGRRHGPRQDGADAGPHPGARRTQAGSTARRWSSPRPAWCRTGRPRPSASRPTLRRAGAARRGARAAVRRASTDHDLVLTTYPLLPRDDERAARPRVPPGRPRRGAGDQEPDAPAAPQRAHRSTPRHRLCLTGTPMENHLGELWSLFDFLMPGPARRRDDVPARVPHARSRSRATRAAQACLTRARSSRSCCAAPRSEVATELPPKTEIVAARRARRARSATSTRPCALLDAREGARRDRAAKGLARSHIVILDALLKLRQVCCDPRLLKLPQARQGRSQSAKLERLMEMLPELVEEGRRDPAVLAVHQHARADRGRARRAPASRIVELTGDTEDRADAGARASRRARCRCS